MSLLHIHGAGRVLYATMGLTIPLRTMVLPLSLELKTTVCTLQASLASHLAQKLISLSLAGSAPDPARLHITMNV